MIINKLYLKKFGKFENKEIEFSPKLNIIYGTNESGKSTIATALKTFFYTDLTGKGKYKKNGIPLSEDKGLFDISYTLDNTNCLKSLVTLGKTNSKTLVKTINEDTGDTKDFDGAKCGEHFFNLTEEMFDSVCYIKDLESISNVIGFKNDVHDKLSKTENNIIDVDLSDVIKKTKEELLVLQRKTSSGKIYPLEKRLEEINSILTELSQIKEALKENESKIDLLKEEETNLKKELEDLSKKEVYLKQYKEYKHSKDQLKLEEEIKNLENEILEKSDDFKEIPQSDIEKIKNLSKNSDAEAKNYKVSFILGLAVCVLSVLLSLTNIIFSACALLSMPLFINGYKTKKLNEKVSKGKEEYINLIQKYNVKSIDDYNNKKEQHLKNENAKNLNKQRLEFLKSQVSDYNKEYKNIYLEEPSFSESDLDFIKEKSKNRLTEITILINSLSEKKNSAFNNMPDFHTLCEERNDLKEKIEKLKEEEQILTHLIEIFGITNNSFKSSYIPYLNKEAKEILNKIFDGDIDHFNINDDLTCEIRKGNSSDIIPKDYFSKGTDALIYFAIRLSIYKLISKDESIPLILDDCFSELDDERFEKIFNYLINNFNGQIIYFTAHKRIFDLPLAKDGIYRL